jgi:hypothetical protein
MIIENAPLRPPFITLFSEPGMGKTILASMFPKAIIVRLEDGIESVPLDKRPAIMPVVKSVDQLKEQLRWVYKERRTHGKKTLIIDSITQAEVMFEKHIVESDPNNPLSINQACGGFGAGVKALGKMHAEIREILGHINDAGIAVIVIAHATTDTVEPPDGQNYSRYNLRLNKHSQAPWVDNVDLVGFLCLQKIVRGAVEDKKIGNKAGKAMSDGTRQLICHGVAGNVSKNRYHIQDAIELPPIEKWQNPLFQLIPYYAQYMKSAKKEEVKAETSPKPEPVEEPQEPDVDSSDLQTTDEVDLDENDFDASDYQAPEL